MNTTELAAAIHPRNKPSYSPNLHKWLVHWSKHHPQRLLPEVWRDQQGMLRIGYQSRSPEESQNCGFIGVRLNAVLCSGVQANKERGWFTNLGPGNMTKLDDFWPQYLAIGRCVIDPEHKTHFINDDDRYTTEKDVRTCTWCGARHRVRIEVQTYTKEIVHHDPMPANQPTTPQRVRPPAPPPPEECRGNLEKCKWVETKPYGSKCTTCGDTIPF